MSIPWKTATSDFLALGSNRATLTGADKPVYSGPFAYVKDANPAEGGKREDLELVNVRLHKIEVSDSDFYAVVVACRIAPEGHTEWGVWCGDGQVSGKYLEDGRNLASVLRLEGKVGASTCNCLESAPWAGKIPDQNNCNFFQQVIRSKGTKVCNHAAVVIDQGISEELLLNMETELKAWLSGETVIPTETLEALSEEDQEVLDAAFIEHVMLAGDRGAGKTFLARTLADRFGAYFLEMQMHPSMEPWEFRSYDRVYNGKVYTVMGKFAEAVYHIQRGKRVVLLMDEFLNMNPAYTTVINTPLSLTANDTYRIETGRIIECDTLEAEELAKAEAALGIEASEGVDAEGKPAKEKRTLGVPEVVEVPSDMLWIVATTNLGAEYGIDKVPPSVLARFKVILMNTNTEKMKKILEKDLLKYGAPVSLANKMIDVTEAVNELQAQKLMDQLITTRMLSNILRAIVKRGERDGNKPKTEKQWVSAIRKEFLANRGQVVNFEKGAYNINQLEAYESILKMHLG